VKKKKEPWAHANNRVFAVCLRALERIFGRAAPCYLRTYMSEFARHAQILLRMHWLPHQSIFSGVLFSINLIPVKHEEAVFRTCQRHMACHIESDFDTGFDSLIDFMTDSTELQNWQSS
jgi:hypothetical protein